MDKYDNILELIKLPDGENLKMELLTLIILEESMGYADSKSSMITKNKHFKALQKETRSQIARVRLAIQKKLPTKLRARDFEETMRKLATAHLSLYFARSLLQSVGLDEKTRGLIERAIKTANAFSKATFELSMTKLAVGPDSPKDERMN